MVFVRNLLPKIGNRGRRRGIGSPDAHEMSQCRRNMVNGYRGLNNGRFHGMSHEDQRCGDIGVAYHLVFIAVLVLVIRSDSQTGPLIVVINVVNQTLVK